MRIGIVLASLLWLTASPQSAPDGSALLAADRAFCAATRARGLEGWLSFFAPDAVVPTGDGRLVEGADAIRAHYVSLSVPPPGLTWEPDAAALATSGELGWSTGSWEIRTEGTPADADVPHGRYLTFWKRQPDGSYRVLADSGGDPAFRTRLRGADGPPREWSSTTERLEAARSGELRLAVGTWRVRTDGPVRTGNFLTAWRLSETGAWAVAAEIGDMR